MTGPLQVRIGVATGPVVVGEGGEESSPGSGAGTPKLAVGETPNLAARLQGLAGPDEIVASAPTRRLAGGNFEVLDLGSHALKGIVEPVQAWKVVGLKQTEGRFEASRAGEQKLSAFVGREQEVGLLAAKWAQASGGEGQVVLLEGEPGIGKSRITQWLLEHIGEGRHYRLRYQCSPYHQSSALYPVIEQMTRAAGFAHDDSADLRLDKIATMAAQAGVQSTQALALLSAAVGADPSGRYGALDLTPQKQKELTLQALAAQVVGLSKAAPVLLLLEDAHWIDPSTLELLDVAVAAIRDQRVLVLITYRPEFKATWTGQSHVSHVTLNRLSSKQTRALAEHVSGGRQLPNEIVNQIIEKTDGIPLFIEELTKAVIEAGLLAEDASENAWRLRGPLSPISIPATLRDSLTARLDRLSPTKEVAQIGACIGREFSYALLDKVAGLSREKLDAALKGLVTSELVFERGVPPDAIYQFKHALVQDAAYEGLLKSRRAQIHATIAEVLSADVEEPAQAQPQVLAHHFGEAQFPERAVPLWLEAGKQSLGRFALPEAIAHFRKGIALLESLAASGDRDTWSVELFTNLGVAEMAMGGWANPPVMTAFEAALPLARKLDRVDLLPIIEWGLWVHTLTIGRAQDSLGWAEQALGEGRERGDVGLTLVGHTQAMITRFWLGDYKAVLAHASIIDQSYRMDDHAYLVATLNHDPKSQAGLYSILAHWMKGYPERAAAACRANDEHVRRIDHPFDAGFALGQHAEFWWLCGRSDEVYPRTDEIRMIGVAHGMPMFSVVIGPIFESFGLLLDGRLDEAESTLETALGFWDAAGVVLWTSFGKSVLAEIKARKGLLGEALAISEAVRNRSETPGNGERAFFPEVLRINGWIKTLKGDVAGAEASYLESLSWARRLEAKSWELRTATSYSRLLLAHGRSDEAKSLLRPVYDWFVEGRDTRDHREARELLQEIES